MDFNASELPATLIKFALLSQVYEEYVNPQIKLPQLQIKENFIFRGWNELLAKMMGVICLFLNGFANQCVFWS